MASKGVFFTMIAIFVIILVIAIVSTRESYRYRERSNAIYSRVRTMNNFIDDFEKDIERGLYIGGYRALISMNSYVRLIENYVDDFDIVFTEILVNGTGNNTEMDLMNQENQGADIMSWLSRVNEEASKLNINVVMDVNDITVTHTTPWNLRVFFNITYNINDQKNIASWTINKEFSKDFSIKGFEDPVYTVETADKVTVLINQTPDTDFVNDGTNDTTVLENHISNSYYIESTTAPSFLMRFTGNLSASEFGIESIVNPVDLSAQSIPIKQRSLVDHVYFGNETTTDFCNVQNMPTWFRIDNANDDTYEVDILTKTSC